MRRSITFRSGRPIELASQVVYRYWPAISRRVAEKLFQFRELDAHMIGVLTHDVRPLSAAEQPLRTRRDLTIRQRGIAYYGYGSEPRDIEMIYSR